MIDIHSHILPGIDDGSKSIEESITIIKNALKNNIKDIVLTPHYILGSDYNSNCSNNKEILSNLKKEIEKNNIDVNLYLGNEIYVENNMIYFHLHLLSTY